MRHPASFPSPGLTRWRGSLLGGHAGTPQYHATNLDSSTSLVAMLTGVQVPYRAHADERLFAVVSHAPGSCRPFESGAFTTFIGASGTAAPASRTSQLVVGSTERWVYGRIDADGRSLFIDDRR